LDHLQWIRSAVSIATIVLFFTGFVSPGFFRSGEHAASSAMPTVDPAELAAPDLTESVDPTGGNCVSSMYLSS
jgi:hypothetical protein